MKETFFLHRAAVAAVLTAALLSAECLAAQPQVRLELVPLDGIFRMYPQAVGGAARPVRIELRASRLAPAGGDIVVRLTAQDIFHQPVEWCEELRIVLPAEGAMASSTFDFQAEQGFFQVFATCRVAGETFEASTGLGVIPPHHRGVRPDSFFASNTSSIRTGLQLRFLQAIGMKVQRTHLNPVRAEIPERPDGACRLDLSGMDRAWQECLDHDTWILPIVGYHFGERMRSELARRTDMHGPPRDVREFVETWETIVRHYPRITTWEFWNEPWIYGWTWAAEPAVYRQFQSAWCRMALSVNPAMRIVAGNSSMFVEDHIEPYPESWQGLLQGTSHHPYSGVHDPTFRNSGQGRSLDQGAVVTRRMGLPYYYMTEAGSSAGDETDAYKLVQYFIRSALAGAFQGNAQWGFGFHENNTRANTTFAVMTHFLEDRPIVADIWPHQSLLWGAVFANPRYVNEAARQLPRAAELNSRWTVPVPDDRRDDRMKVAAVWSHTGPSAGQQDRNGTLSLSAPGDIRAFDMVGREIPRRNGTLTVPFGERVVWFTTEQLDVASFRNRLAKAMMTGVTPVNVSALSLLQPAGEAQPLGVRLENQLNRSVTGTLTLIRHADDARRSVPFTLPAGRLQEIAVEWPAGSLPTQARYDVTFELQTDCGDMTHRQELAVARFLRRSISVDGKLDDWADALPVFMDSAHSDGKLDPTQALLNPGRVKMETGGGGRVVLRVYTAYDERNIYVAAAVREPQLVCRAGQPVTRRGRTEVVTLPYRMGEPEGLEHIRNCGDAFFMAFGFRDRVPGWGRQMDDPWAWKGHFYDTDYQYVVHTSATGPQLIRQWGADTSRRTAYQTAAVPGVGPVAGAQVKIQRDEAAQLTVYEMAIPRDQLKLFDPAAGRLRFGFVLSSGEIGWPLQWASAAGVFDYWIGSGSFSPSWVSVLPCQTFFGIEP
ncbi:MAG: hypothetical protein IH624_18630 [Phycisphaerae bacterium]|nr:hypothetical protein [Phycisphaerae bacterium]